MDPRTLDSVDTVAEADLGIGPLTTPGLLDHIIGCSPVGIAVIDHEGLFRVANPAYARIFDCQPQDLLRCSFLSVLPAADRDRLFGLHQHFLEYGGELKGELDVMRADGTLRRVLSESVRLPGASGAAPQRLVYLVDITDRRRMELAQQQQHAFVQSVLDAIGADVCVVDAQGVIVAVNRAWREFGVAQGGLPERAGIGCNYLAVCERKATPAAEGAAEAVAFAAQLRDVLGGRLAGFELEYPCHSPQQRRWFLARVSRIDGSEPLRVVIAHDDVSTLKLAQETLRESEQTYRTLFETVAQGVVYHDTAGRITSANPAAVRILGLSLSQLQGRDSIDPRWHAVHEDGRDFPGTEHPAIVALQTGEPVKDVVMGVAVPGREQVWILVSAVPLWRDGAINGVYASFEDITQRVRLGRELQRQARTDDLTGLANRRSLMQHLRDQYDRLQRHPELHACVLALDLDHFKAVNDHWGHAAGDAVLVHVARLMQSQLRSADLVGRSGGEEFVALLPDTRLDEAEHLAGRLREAIAATPTCHGGHGIPITVSIGAAAVQATDADAEAVLLRADRALYEAKAAGRNTVRCAAPAA